MLTRRRMCAVRMRRAHRGVAGMEVLVICIGNLLMGDDGLGSVAAQALAGSMPPGVRVVDAGTAAGSYIPDIALAKAVIVVDAMRGGQPAGTVYRIPGFRLESWDPGPSLSTVSSHSQGLGQAFHEASCLCGRDPLIIFYGVEPQDLSLAIGLSEPVSRALPFLVQSVRDEASNLARQPEGQR